MKRKYEYYIRYSGCNERLKMSKKEAYKSLEELITKEVANFAGFGISIVDYKHINQIFRRLENGCRTYCIIGVLSISREEVK